ncbi:hypothetical protein C8J57DRAFT_1090355 [Mycena rebaudengoi]|nr:hypothetical protein C8J57DRAFT_1090355 [Mycena rebaudengoi]
MIKHRGPRRASFMWGSSTRNTRVERLWVEVGTQFARRWPQWNLHPLGGTRNKGQSPSANYCYPSQLQTNNHGVEEDQPGVHPTILEEFYGVEEDLDVDDRIALDQADDVRHEAVEVPSHGSPFNAELEAVFFEALEEVKAQEILLEEFTLPLDDYPRH